MDLFMFRVPFWCTENIDKAATTQAHMKQLFTNDVQVHKVKIIIVDCN